MYSAEETNNILEKTMKLARPVTVRPLFFHPLSTTAPHTGHTQ